MLAGVLLVAGAVLYTSAWWSPLLFGSAEQRRVRAATTGERRYVDDTLGLLDAIRLGWRLRSLDPTPVELPVRNGSNQAGAVLFLVDPDAQAALDQFR